jgi:hypothetical protein
MRDSPASLVFNVGPERALSESNTLFGIEKVKNFARTRLIDFTKPFSKLGVYDRSMVWKVVASEGLPG